MVKNSGIVLTGVNATLSSYASSKIEELDTKQQSILSLEHIAEQRF